MQLDFESWFEGDRVSPKAVLETQTLILKHCVDGKQKLRLSASQRLLVLRALRFEASPSANRAAAVCVYLCSAEEEELRAFFADEEASSVADLCAGVALACSNNDDLFVPSLVEVLHRVVALEDTRLMLRLMAGVGGAGGVHALLAYISSGPKFDCLRSLVDLASMVLFVALRERPVWEDENVRAFFDALRGSQLSGLLLRLVSTIETLQSLACKSLTRLALILSVLGIEYEHEEVLARLKRWSDAHQGQQEYHTRKSIARLEAAVRRADTSFEGLSRADLGLGNAVRARKQLIEMRCQGCGKTEGASSFLVCSRCSRGRFCSSSCSDANWRAHRLLCAQT